MALAIPPDYGRKVTAGGRSTLQLVADGTDSNSTGVAMSYAQALIAGNVPGTGLVRAEIQVWFNPRLESRDFMIPGIVALLLLVITTNLSAMAIVVPERDIPSSFRDGLAALERASAERRRQPVS